jgi:putative aldouronate transport system substrate-binding protein
MANGINGYGAYLNYWLEKDGKLVYSSVQPEIRPALLKLQELYKEGLVNKDFAALTDPVAREYVAAGKTGIYYSAAWMGTQGMNTLVENTPEFRTKPEKMLAWVFPPPAVKGQAIKVQTNSPKGYRIFVSNKCANPEAVLKIATMTYRYGHSGKENYRYYIEGDWNYFKYIPWGDHMTPVNWDLYRGARDTGSGTVRRHLPHRCQRLEYYLGFLSAGRRGYRFDPFSVDDERAPRDFHPAL